MILTWFTNRMPLMGLQPLDIIIFRLTLDDLQEIGVAEYELGEPDLNGFTDRFSITPLVSEDDFLRTMRDLINLYKASDLPLNCATIH